MYRKPQEVPECSDLGTYRPEVEQRTSGATHMDIRKREIKKEILEKCPIVKGLLKKFGAEQKQQNVDTASITSIKNLPKDTKCYFIDVCTFSNLACFFEEDDIFTNRYLIAETPMKVLVTPMYWLHQNNRANIWNRIKIYLRDHVPNSEQVFEKFIKNRKWLNYKKQVTRDVLGECFVDTVWSDIPYSLRIAEYYKDPSEK